MMHASEKIKYISLRDQIRENKWKCHLRTIEVGARGLVCVSRCLRLLGFTGSQSRSMFTTYLFQPPIALPSIDAIDQNIGRGLLL